MDTDCSLGWPKVMRAVAKSAAPTEQFRRFLLDVYRHHGDHILILNASYRSQAAQMTF
jgi:hypothetical protein